MFYGHNYETGHTCPNCGKTGIPCTIEDGYCENSGPCDDCLVIAAERRAMRAEQVLDDYQEWEDD